MLFRRVIGGGSAFCLGDFSLDYGFAAGKLNFSSFPKPNTHHVLMSFVFRKFANKPLAVAICHTLESCKYFILVNILTQFISSPQHIPGGRRDKHPHHLPPPQPPQKLWRIV